MKKTIAIILLFSFCLSLCACSFTPDAEVVYVSAEEQAPPLDSEPTADTAAAQSDAADAEAAETLFSIMEELYTNYHPGTAGSSLTLAALTGRMLDWYELRGSAGAISKAAAAFASVHEDYAALDESSEIPLGFPASLAAGWRCAADMSFSFGDEILSDAGYTRSTEWSPSHTELFFTQLFAAFGLREPESVKLYYGTVSSVRYPAEANEYSLIAALRTAGVIDYDTELIAFSHDGGQLTLDFSSGITSALNSLDSDGEHFAVGCIVNTFLDAFEADSIFLTVDGNALSTDRVTYDYAITRNDI